MKVNKTKLIERTIRKMALDKQFVKFPKAHSISNKSLFYLRMENFEDISENTGFVSKKLRFLDSDVVWWISILVNNGNNDNFVPQSSESTTDITLRFHFDMELRVLRTGTWSFSVSGVANDKRLLPSSCHIRYPLSTHDVVIDSTTIFKQNVLELNVEVALLGKMSSEFLQKSINPSINRKEILFNSKRILNNPNYSDFTFFIEGQEFKVHKCILAAASHFFNQIFSARLSENDINECHLNTDPVIFQYLLKFIYSGELPNNHHQKDLCLKLFEAAHYFEIKNLTVICKQSLLFQLSLENASELYDWAFLYGLEDVKTDAWNFIKINILKVSTPTQPLSPEIVSHLIEKRRQVDILLENYQLQRSELEELVKLLSNDKF